MLLLRRNKKRRTQLEASVRMKYGDIYRNTEDRQNQAALKITQMIKWKIQICAKIHKQANLVLSYSVSQLMKQIVVQFLKRFNFWQTVFPENTMGAETVLTTQCNAMDPALMQKCANVFFKLSLQYQNIEEKIQ